MMVKDTNTAGGGLMGFFVGIFNSAANFEMDWTGLINGLIITSCCSILGAAISKILKIISK